MDNSGVFVSIKGYEGYYEINKLGVVKSLERSVYFNSLSRLKKENILKHNKSKNGYYYVQLNKNGIFKNHYIHRLIAKAFIPNPDNKTDVNHINCIKTDNRAFGYPITQSLWGKKGVRIHSQHSMYLFDFDGYQQSDNYLTGVKALPNEIPAPEPKGYCIKRTPENAEVLNRWINSLYENRNVDSKFKNDSPVYFYSQPVSFGVYSNCGTKQLEEGFTELHSVEEFFAKVNYTPEPAPEEQVKEESDFVKKPPIELMPKWRHTELRISETLRAIMMYKSDNMLYPKEWDEELIELLTENSVKIEVIKEA